MTTELERLLIRQIELAGPMTVADYMAACLYHPGHGYYMAREPFGRAGDFITAPEISQIFGELVAIWAVQAWHSVGRPRPFAFAEIGPGRGTLMADMLRTLHALAPDMLGSAAIAMIETSPRLREVQRRTLAARPEPVEWTESVDGLPDLPLILVGNEVFDAIPMRQYVRTRSGWLERRVGLDAGGRLCFGAGAGAPDPGLLPAAAPDAPEGTIFETAPAREALAERVATHIAAFGGAAIFFDYGHLRPGFGDTLQAVRRHAPADVLAAPGEADLTAHVDFAALARACRRRGVETGFMSQGRFLVRMGLLERAKRLSAGADPDTRKAIGDAAARLSAPDRMGRLFKVMAIHAEGRAPYPFDHAGEGAAAS